MYTERRMGKTSLVIRGLDKLPKMSFIAVYVDLWPSVSLDDAGHPKVDFGIDGRSVSKNLTEVLAAPQALAERSGKR